jgi:hypothetical protein
MRGAIQTIVCSALVTLPGCKVETHPPVEATPSGTIATLPEASTGPSPSASPSEPPSTVPAPPVARALPKYEPGPTSAALCEDFVRNARHHDATLPTLGDFGGGGFPVVTFDTACFPTPKGAWALEVGAARSTTDVRDGKRVTVELKGSYHAVHLDAHGRRSVGPPIPFVADEWQSFELAETLFDYDGDGEPELLLHTKTTEHTAAGTSSEVVFTAGGGAVRRYAPAAAFATTMSADIDSDGRPDLLYTGEEPFRIEGTSDTPHTSRVSELLFAAHSLPDGHFSARDAAAVAYVKEQCPSPPASIVGDEAEASVKSVHCARAWGVSTADIKAQVARDCVRPKPRDARLVPKCANYDMMMTWAEFVPPVQLGDAGP